MTERCLLGEAQCPECQSDANSNKHGCGTPAQAQASARVDVHTARVFPAWTTESNMSASFRANAQICVHQSTDRDLESFNVNAWICAQSTTNRDFETEKVNAWIRAPLSTDHDPALDQNLQYLHRLFFFFCGFTVCGINKTSVNVCNLMRMYCFGNWF